MFFPKANASNPNSALQPEPGAPTSGEAAGAPVIPKANPRPGFGANDGPVDDFIALAESWQDDAGNAILSQADPEPAQQQGMLDRIAAEFSAVQMRQLGARLLKLADALDGDWSPDEARASYHSMTRAGRIERQALNLAQVAMRLRRAARLRCRHLSPEWFGEPAWEMLLELFIQFAGGARVSTKSLVLASGAPDTTALRVIDRLVEAELVERSPSQMDKRVTLVCLTRRGVIAVGSILTEADA